MWCLMILKKYLTLNFTSKYIKNLIKKNRKANLILSDIIIKIILKVSGLLPEKRE